MESEVHYFEAVLREDQTGAVFSSLIRTLNKGYDLSY